MSGQGTPTKAVANRARAPQRVERDAQSAASASLPGLLESAWQHR